MAEFRSSKALLYREWLNKRWAAVVVFLLIAPSVYLQTLTPLSGNRIVHVGTNGHMHAVDVVALNFAVTSNQISSRYTMGMWAALVVVVLALYSVWIERRQETFWFTFGGPVSKASVLRVKFLVDASVIVGVFTILAISLAIIDGAVHAHYPVAGIGRWWLAEVSMLLAMYSVTVLVSSLIGNALASLLVVFGVSFAPMYIGVLLEDWLGANLMYFYQSGTAQIPFSWKLMWIFSHASPMNWYDTPFLTTWGHPILFFLWFLVFSFLSCWAAVALFQRASNERLRNLFVFRRTEHLASLVLSGVVASIVVHTTFHQSPTSLISYLLWFCVITLILWVGYIMAKSRWFNLYGIFK